MAKELEWAVSVLKHNTLHAIGCIQAEVTGQ